ncbi:MAG: hypothetical protein IT456_13995 [Planctomycetes bacterium]|nr:hypothetical protein [Planctomycetota bacterium]
MNDDHDPRLDAGLREVLGAVTPPDLREQVRARLGLRPGRTVRSQSRWAMAALVLLGLAVVTWLAIERAPRQVVPLAGPQEPVGMDVAQGREGLLRLDPRTRKLRVYQLATEDMALLVRFPELRELELWNVLPTEGALPHEENLAALSGLTKLQKLTLLGPWTGVGLAALEALPMLEEITLLSSRVGKEGLLAIAKLRNLRGLHLRHAQSIDLEAVTVLVAMTQLRALSLQHTWKVPKAGFLQLATMTALEALDVGDNDGGARSSRMGEAGDGVGVDDEVLAALVTLPKLRSLSLNRCFHVTPGGMAALAKCKDLRVLDLTALSACVPAALNVLPPTLRELRLEYCEVKQEMLEGIVGEQPQLEVLDLSGALAATHINLQKLSELPNLQRLAVRDTKVTLGFDYGLREHLEPVAVLRTLRFLDLAGWSALTVGDCESIAAMPALEELRLANIDALDDAMLQALGRSRSLRRLAIGGHHVGVTLAGLRRLANLQLDGLDLKGPSSLSHDDLVDANVLRAAVAELWPSALVVLPDGSTFRAPPK